MVDSTDPFVFQFVHARLMAGGLPVPEPALFDELEIKPAVS